MRRSFTESLSVCCITFNMHGEQPSPQAVDQLLSKHKKLEYDCYIIGSEECLRSILFSLVYWDKTTWEEMLHEYLGKDKYQIIASQTLSAIHIIGFIKTDLFKYIKKVGNNYIKTGGLYNMMGNKGACYIYFRFKDITLLFINSHLAAFKNNNQKRIENFEYIVNNITVGTPDDYKKLFGGDKEVYNTIGKDILNEFDNAIFMGDLNSRSECDLYLLEPFLENKDINKLLLMDQLINSVKNEQVDLLNFQESVIRFMPTFKFVPGTVDTYAKTEENTPSFTDRILFKVKLPDKMKLEILTYESNPNITFSDHKPVILTYNLFF